MVGTAARSDARTWWHVQPTIGSDRPALDAQRVPTLSAVEPIARTTVPLRLTVVDGETVVLPAGTEMVRDPMTGTVSYRDAPPVDGNLPPQDQRTFVPYGDGRWIDLTAPRPDIGRAVSVGVTTQPVELRLVEGSSLLRAGKTTYPLARYADVVRDVATGEPTLYRQVGEVGGCFEGSLTFARADETHWIGVEPIDKVGARLDQVEAVRLMDPTEITLAEASTLAAGRVVAEGHVVRVPEGTEAVLDPATGRIIELRVERDPLTRAHTEERYVYRRAGEDWVLDAGPRQCYRRIGPLRRPAGGAAPNPAEVVRARVRR
jgi:hypothetical protein